MLPLQRWPEFLGRVAWALIAPHRAALDYRRRLERELAIGRELNLEVQRLGNDAATWERTAKAWQADFNELKREHGSLHQIAARDRSAANEAEAERRRLATELESEQARHRETALNLEREQGKMLVLKDQMDILVQWRESELKRLAKEARIHEIAGRGKSEE